MRRDYVIDRFKFVHLLHLFLPWTSVTFSVFFLILKKRCLVKEKIQIEDWHDQSSHLIHHLHNLHYISESHWSRNLFQKFLGLVQDLWDISEWLEEVLMIRSFTYASLGFLRLWGWRVAAPSSSSDTIKSLSSDTSSSTSKFGESSKGASSCRSYRWRFDEDLWILKRTHLWVIIVIISKDIVSNRVSNSLFCFIFIRRKNFDSSEPFFQSNS